MLTVLFSFLMLIVFGKLLIWGLKAAWGLTRLFFTVLFLPLVLVVLAVEGLMFLALPLLLVIGAASLVCARR